MSLNSKQKGNSGERECAKILNERFPGRVFKRVPQSGAIFGQSNKIGAENVDSEIKTTLSGDIICPLDFRFSVEHKFYQAADFWGLFNEKSDLHSWMKQCEEDSAFSNKQPMLIVKYNNHKRIVFVKEDHPDHIFEHRGWFCYWLEDYLKKPDCFFFEK